MSDPIKSAHATFQEHMKRMEARNPAPAPTQNEIFLKAIAEGKNPAAVYMSSLGASKGGKARAKALTKARRQEIGRKAAQARWGK